MANKVAPPLDTIFRALSDPTRRAVISRLGQGPAQVTDLAAPHGMALPSFLKHLGMLERSGLVTSRKLGRKRICTLRPEAFREAEMWLEDQRRLGRAQLDRLEDLATNLERETDDE